MNSFHVSIKQTNNFSAKELIRLFKCVSIWEGVWNSAEFKKAVMEFGHYKDDMGDDVPGFHFGDGEFNYSNSTIYSRITLPRVFSIKKSFWIFKKPPSDFQKQLVTFGSSDFKKLTDLAIVQILAQEAGCFLSGFEIPAGSKHKNFSVPIAVGIITHEIASNMGLT